MQIIRRSSDKYSSVSRPNKDNEREKKAPRYILLLHINHKWLSCDYFPFWSQDPQSIFKWRLILIPIVLLRGHGEPNSTSLHTCSCFISEYTGIKGSERAEKVKVKINSDKDWNTTCYSLTNMENLIIFLWQQDQVLSGCEYKIKMT